MTHYYRNCHNVSYSYVYICTDWMSKQILNQLINVMPGYCTVTEWSVFECKCFWMTQSQITYTPLGVLFVNVNDKCV